MVTDNPPTLGRLQIKHVLDDFHAYVFALLLGFSETTLSRCRLASQRR